VPIWRRLFCGFIPGFFLLAAASTQPALAATRTAQTVRDEPNRMQEWPLLGELKAYEEVLENGLTVVLIPNMRAPTVSVYHWVKGGSLHETQGITGIAHLFEHMMFRPVRPGEPNFHDKVQKLGGEENASTRFESTVYTSTVPPRFLPDLLKVESERFKNLRVTDDLLNVERKAVWSEYSTKMDSNPVFDLWYQVYALGFPKHPLGWHIIGERADLDKINARDCNDFFARIYRPNNVGLFISGSFDRKKIMPLVRRFYGDWRKGPVAKLPPEFKHEGGFVKGEGKLESRIQQMLVGFRTPLLTVDNAEGFSLLNHVLFGSQFSLARKRLVHEKKFVSDVSDFNFDYDNGMLKAFLTLLPSATSEGVVDELLALRVDVAALKEEEFAAYKREYRISLAEAARRNEVLNDLAAQHWGRFGSLSTLARTFKSESTLTKADLQALIDRYFIKDNAVVITSKQAAKQN